jgi:hypothetical protein
VAGRGLATRDEGALITTSARGWEKEWIARQHTEEEEEEEKHTDTSR